MVDGFCLSKRKHIDDLLAGRWGNSDGSGYWVRKEKENIDRMVKKYLSGELLLDKDGAGYWAVNGNYIFDDNAYEAHLGGVPINLDATFDKREAQVSEQLAKYRKNWRPPSGEALAEMRSAFGAGEVVVDVLSGKVIQL